MQFFNHTFYFFSHKKHFHKKVNLDAIFVSYIFTNGFYLLLKSRFQLELFTEGRHKSFHEERTKTGWWIPLENSNPSHVRAKVFAEFDPAEEVGSVAVNDNEPELHIVWKMQTMCGGREALQWFSLPLHLLPWACRVLLGQTLTANCKLLSLTWHHFVHHKKWP